MRLADAWIHGLRRFGGNEAHRVRIDTKLVCLIGANEAGKSTILHAMEIAQSDDPVGPADRTRLEQIGDDRQIVYLRYRLEDADRNALSDIRCEGDSRAVQWFDFVRRANGTPASTIRPEPAS
jgi:recombinational DNA repair ATPase RecF